CKTSGGVSGCAPRRTRVASRVGSTGTISRPLTQRNAPVATTAAFDLIHRPIGAEHQAVERFPVPRLLARELIASEARDQIGGTERLAQQGGGAPQHVVARFMTQPVVDRLEVVEIGEHEGTGLVIAVLAGGVTLDLLQERAPVEQAGERGGARLLGHVEL